MAKLNESAGLSAVSSSTEAARAARDPEDQLPPEGWRTGYALQALGDINALADLVAVEGDNIDQIAAHALMVRLVHLSTIGLSALGDERIERSDLHLQLYGHGISRGARS